MRFKTQWTSRRSGNQLLSKYVNINNVQTTSRDIQMHLARVKLSYVPSVAPKCDGFPHLSWTAALFQQTSPSRRQQTSLWFFPSVETRATLLLHVQNLCPHTCLSNQMSEGCRHACSRGCQRVAQASVESLFHSKGSSTPLQFRKIKTAFTKQTAAVEAAARDAGNRLSSANLGADFVGKPDAVCVPEACKHSLSVWL